MRKVGENGTWYSFLQEDVFAHLSGSLCNFFLYMLSRSADPKYLRYLHQPVDQSTRAEFGQKHRSMWSTASIIHAAGMGVDTNQGLLTADKIRVPMMGKRLGNCQRKILDDISFVSTNLVNMNKR